MLYTSSAKFCLSVCSAACMSTLSSVIITPHEYYMIRPVVGVCAASVYYLALALHINAITSSM